MSFFSQAAAAMFQHWRLQLATLLDIQLFDHAIFHQRRIAL